MCPQDLALPRGPPQTKQSIVPQLLIDHYVSMIDPSRAQTVDNDIARHCAFSIPAVALTLGRANWPLIRETYETLANDMQWKVGGRNAYFEFHQTNPGLFRCEEL